MRLFLLTSLTMMAFAANSVLNRAALASGGIGPEAFGTIRLAAGAVMLTFLAVVLRGRLRLGGRGRVAGVAGLLLYIYGFSLAYSGLETGLGALLLFGMVQLTMFGGALALGERPPARRWLGAGFAFAGLAWLLWPGTGAVISPWHGFAMALAGFGWGVYSLAGRGSADPLMASAANMVLAAPIGLVVAHLLPGAAEPVTASASGITLAVISGAVTSGLGYALWYSVLPKLAGSVAAVAQLTVPLIAMAGGMIFLAEPLSRDFVIAAVVVLGGVALSVLPFPKRA